jgi:phage terminase large subunit-like protein
VQIGLDLSQKTDLTAAVCAAVDEDGGLHLITHAFAPSVGIEARALRDRVPYGEWVRMGVLNASPAEVVDYDAVCLHLVAWLTANQIEVNRVAFDRWRINDFKRAAERCGFAQGAEWREVGQGFRDMSPRVESFETALLRGRVRHGSHPVLNMGASCAVVTVDPAGGRKLDKSQGTQRIDALVAAVMASHELLAGEVIQADVSHWIA